MVRATPNSWPFPAIAPHSNLSLLGAVSVSGKRNFEARDKGAEIALGSRCGHSQRPSARAQARQFGRFRQKPGKSLLDRTAWWAREDSNLPPTAHHEKCCMPSMRVQFKHQCAMPSLLRLSFFIFRSVERCAESFLRRLGSSHGCNARS